MPSGASEAYDVELIPIDAEERGLRQFNRRDFAMMGIGAATALFAVGVGYTASRKLKKDHE